MDCLGAAERPMLALEYLLVPVLTAETRMGLSRARKIRALRFLTEVCVCEGKSTYRRDASVSETPMCGLCRWTDLVMANTIFSSLLPGVVPRGCQPPQPRRLLLVSCGYPRGGGSNQLWTP